MYFINNRVMFGAGSGGPTSYWISTLAPSSNLVLQGKKVITDEFGNVIVLGQFIETSETDTLLLAKYNVSGALQWQRSLSNGKRNAAQAVLIDGSNSVIAVAKTDLGKGLVAKTDASGATQAVRLLEGAAFGVNGAALDSLGNVHVVGGQVVGGTGLSGLSLVKIDGSGSILWQRLLGVGDQAASALGVAVDNSGNVYAVGRLDPSGAASDIILAKCNGSGESVWQRSLSSSGNESVVGIALDPAGNVYVLGSLNSNSSLGVAKYNANGAMQWQRSLSGEAFVSAGGIAVDSKGVYVVGTVGLVAGGQKLLIAKYSVTGALEWQRDIIGASPTSVQGEGVAVDASGSVTVVGTYQPSSGTPRRLLTARLPADGTLTGTYGDFVYSATSLTNSTSTLVSASVTVTNTDTSLSSAATLITNATTTMTSVTTTL